MTLFTRRPLTSDVGPTRQRFTPVGNFAPSQGWSPIRANLSLSVRTIETHKYEMMETLGLHSKAELVRWLDRRLISD